MQQALSMPEIVAGVIEQLVDDDSLDRAELLANLFSCALVNRTWSTEAISALWSYPTDPWSSQHPGHLPWYFASLEASRRQTYATLVYEADLSTDDLLANYNYAVAGLAFPNLHRIRIQVAETLHPKLPQMDGHHVRCLQIDPEVDAPGIFALDEDGLDELLDRIAVCLGSTLRQELTDFAGSHFFLS